MATLSTEKSQAIINKVVADPLRKLAQNACTRSDLKSVMVNRERSTQYNHNYSVKVDPQLKVTNQKASGRCWMFAALNVARAPLIKKYKLEEDFEFSQSYTFFWDKAERANYFLETMIELADEPLEGRMIQHLLSDPLCDGGQWDMFVNVVNKYGLVPKSAYPEAFSSSNSRSMNWLLTHKLRGWAAEVRDSKTLEERRTLKDKYLEEFIGVLCVSLGTPPTTFDWSFMNKDKKHTIVKGLTPLSFVKDYVQDAGFDFNAYVSLINDPRNAYSKTYTVNKLGNVLDAPEVRYINVEIDVIRKHSMRQLDNNEPVWFGCDVGKHFQRDMGVMDTELFDYNLVFGTKPTMDKKTRLLYNDSLMTHAMVFTGYDKGADGPTKWLVENSWGEPKPNGVGSGDPYSLGSGKGYLMMTDEWFDQYMYQIIVKKTDLESELLTLLDETPDRLPAWDPMGALASVH